MQEEQKIELATTTEDVASPAKDRVTLELVRATIGDGDPNTWSAQKLLDAIGSGSKRTHQKHLDFLRLEHAKAAMPQLAEADVVPPMPKDLGDSFWRQAWTLAVSKSATHITKITVKRDALKVQLETAKADINSLLDSSDTADERIKKILADAIASTESAAAEKIRADAAVGALEELKQTFAKNLADQTKISEDVCNGLIVELEHVKQHSKEKLELAEKDALLLLKGLQEVNSQQAQREFDLRNQIAAANRRADESTRRADILAERLAGLSQPGKVQADFLVLAHDRLEPPLESASGNAAE